MFCDSDSQPYGAKLISTKSFGSFARKGLFLAKTIQAGSSQALIRYCGYLKKARPDSMLQCANLCFPILS